VKPVLDGTVALVTGASSGIGAATAAALAAQGAAVALAARRRDRLDALAAGIRERGGTALVLESDITDQQQATEAVERTVSELGRLDTLVNNAGVMLLGPAVGAPQREWQQMIELNVLGLLSCAHAALPHLLRAAGDDPRHVADMLNISSAAGRVARSGAGVYNLTKFGVGAFSESLRQELIDRHVRISLVEPGAVETELRRADRRDGIDWVESSTRGPPWGSMTQSRTGASPPAGCSRLTRAPSRQSGRTEWRSRRQLRRPGSLTSPGEPRRRGLRRDP
jgi:NADP-dependent 3-hydroxy acid dehydrogenase YdfG